jgi:hypothetical protein
MATSTPNLFAATTAVPHTLSVTPSNASRTALLAAPSAGTTYKINQIIAANIDGTGAYSATVEIRDQATSTYNAIASTISIPPNASLIVSDKTTLFYLVPTDTTGEGSGVYVTSSTGSKIVYTISYEAIT